MADDKPEAPPKNPTAHKKYEIKGETLENVTDIFRGISISPNSNIISKSKGKDKVSIIKGNDISKSSFTNGFFIDIKKLLSNSSKLEEFQKRNWSLIVNSKHHRSVLKNLLPVAQKTKEIHEFKESTRDS